MTEVLLRSRLPAPPPQKLILAAARGPNKRTPDPTSKGLAFIFTAKEATPQGCPRDQTAPAPGVCHAPGTVTKKLQRSDKGILSAARSEGQPKLAPCAPSPDGEGGGKGEDKKKGPPKGPRAISRALH